MFTAWSGFLLLKCIITQMYCVTIVILWHTVEQQKEKMWEGKAAGPGDVVTAERCSVSTGGLATGIYNPEGGAFVMQIELPFISLCFNSVVSRLKYTTKCLRLWLWVVGVHTIPDALSRNPSCVIVESKLSLSQISADHVARHTSFSNVVICSVDVTSHSCCTQ